jgi:hypothetical protein
MIGVRVGAIAEIFVPFCDLAISPPCNVVRRRGVLLAPPQAMPKPFDIRTRAFEFACEVHPGLS